MAALFGSSSCQDGQNKREMIMMVVMTLNEGSCS